MAEIISLSTDMLNTITPASNIRSYKQRLPLTHTHDKFFFLPSFFLIAQASKLNIHFLQINAILDQFALSTRWYFTSQYKSVLILTMNVLIQMSKLSIYLRNPLMLLKSWMPVMKSTHFSLASLLLIVWSENENKSNFHKSEY